jgi:predicted signal transduction protein with EAL and GGDEF domain
VSITASVGVALTGPAEVTPQQLLDRADVAMYSAKRRGGGQAQLADPWGPDPTTEGAAPAADPDVA